jgi:hypothetical protein
MKASDNQFPSILVTEQASKPAAPVAGDQRLYMKTDHKLYHENSDGTETEVGIDPNNDYYSYLAALLEPDALEAEQIGAFTYAVNSSTTKYIMASYASRLGAAGRMEVRNPFKPMALRGVTLYGLGATSSAILLNPALPSYANARTTYFSRLKTLADSSLKVVNVLAPATYYPLLPGPYGAIIMRVMNFDFDYIAARTPCQATGWNMANEEKEGDSQRNDNPLTLAVNKFTIAEVFSGAERTAGVGLASVAYVLLPSTWSVITDPNAYNFRDDFMLTSLDTATKWVRAQSSVGNVEINTDFAWLKLIGTSTWGQNGAYSQTSISRANGKIFMADIYVGRNDTTINSAILGFSDGGGQSYTNFSHGVLFTSTGAANVLYVFEDGNSREVIGSGYTNGCVYRIKITLNGNAAVYAIQGGSEYGALGSTSWTTITPGTTFSSTTPLYAGVSSGQTGTMYIGDVRIY